MAEPSRKSWSVDKWEFDPARGYPVCHVCGARITLNERDASFHSRCGRAGGPVSVHQSCGGLAVLKGAASGLGR